MKRQFSECFSLAFSLLCALSLARSLAVSRWVICRARSSRYKSPWIADFAMALPFALVYGARGMI